MEMILNKIWNKIINYGTSDNSRDHANKKIRVTNIALIISAFALNIFSILNWYLGLHELILLDTFISVVAILCMFLISKKLYKIGYFITFGLLPGFFFIYPYFIGNIGAEYYYFFFLVIGFYILDKKSTIFVFSIYIFLLFIGSKYFIYHNTFNEKYQILETVHYYPSIIASVIMLMIATYVFKNDTVVYLQAIKLKNVELEEIKEEINAQNELLEVRNSELAILHNDLTSSLDYASHIQNAILPQEDLRGQLLPEHFIFFKPKNIVSGDFYWLNKVEERTIIAAADCTGHGVPGAFMSMLGVSFLNDVVNKEYITHPGVILRRLRKEVINALQQKGKFGEQQDGMDIALCSIDFENLELQFSGANNPLYLIRDKEKEVIKEAIIFENSEVNLYEIKGDNMPIAIHERMDKFKTHEFKLFKGDCLYIFSDGFADQFGGEYGKKFRYKPFKDLLLANAKKPMQQQIDILNNTLNKWQGSYEQVDDILVIGVKI